VARDRSQHDKQFTFINGYLPSFSHFAMHVSMYHFLGYTSIALIMKNCGRLRVSRVYPCMDKEPGIKSPPGGMALKAVQVQREIW